MTFGQTSGGSTVAVREKHGWLARLRRNALRRTSLRQTVFLRRADRQMLARAQTQWIFVDLASGRPRAIPEAVRTAFATIASEDAALAGILRPR